MAIINKLESFQGQVLIVNESFVRNKSVLPFKKTKLEVTYWINLKFIYISLVFNYRMVRKTQL